MSTKILIVDDEVKIVKLVRSYLEQAGFAVVDAGDGQTALIQARRERPDLIVLDLGLPGFSLDYAFPTGGLIAAAVIGLCFALLAALLPARQAARLEIVAALQYE